MFVFSARSIANLRGVDPGLILVLSRGLLYSPYDFAITEGLRTQARQYRLYQEGKSKTLDSKHLYGRAVDVVAVGDLDGDGDCDAQDRARTWDREIYTAIAVQGILRAAKELNRPVRWGGHFKSFFDGPHFERI